MYDWANSAYATIVLAGFFPIIYAEYFAVTIDSSESSAEEAVIGNLRSAVEVYAMDQVVANSVKSYPLNPFDALDTKSKNDLLYSKGWWFSSGNVRHTRNDGSEVTWGYNASTGEIN